jgi:predicted short-subunit dehydrogenase-like oxidoreductase (DUF2520 family)
MKRAGTVIVGRGKVGRALFGALAAHGHSARLVAGRTVSVAAIGSARIVVLALPDAALTAAAERLAQGLARGVVVLHCAGRLGLEPLAACAGVGAAVGVMHPLVSFASKRRSPALLGATFVIAGSPRAVAAARSLARLIGAHPLIAPVHGAAYHAAAAMLAGGSVALAGHATNVFVGLGVARPDARRALAGLLASIAANLAQLDAPEALTGPVARGDAAAVAAHRASLGALAPEALSVYDAIAPAVLDIAVRAGLDERHAREVRRALSRASPRATRRRAPRRSLPR